MPPSPQWLSVLSLGPTFLEQNHLKRRTGDWRATASDEGLVIESWSEGFMVGALVIMGCITVANMRRGVLLHKLILVEQLLALTHGTFCFMSFKGYDWYLSSTAALLYLSWIIHNVVAWMKVHPFFSQQGGFFRPKIGIWTTRIYLGTLALAVPVVIIQIVNNFRFFNNRGGWYGEMRPYESLTRDPWWIFTCIILFVVISRCYGTGIIQLVRRSPRFGILLTAIIFSVVFTICDIVATIQDSTIIGSSTGSTEGINPWWKLSLVFKCLTDTIMLDDFKTELKRLGVKRIAQEEKMRNGMALVVDEESITPLAHGGNADDEEGSNQSGLRSRSWYGGRDQTSGRSSSPGSNLSPTTTRTKVNGQSYNTRPLKNPNAEMEELEFSTALALDPSRLSGVGSVGGERDDPNEIQVGKELSTGLDESLSKRGSLERSSVTQRTTRISELPRLQQTQFEAIKPGKKTRQFGPTLEDTNDNHDGENTIVEIDPVLPQSPTEKDLQLFAASGSNVRNTGNNSFDIISHTDDQDHSSDMRGLNQIKETTKSNTNASDERKMRERRFRQSIGAPSP